MTKLQLLRTLYQTGIVIAWGYRTTKGFYPLRWLGKRIMRGIKAKLGLFLFSKFDIK